LHAHHSRGQIVPSYITDHTLGINFYDSIVVLEKGDMRRKEAIRVGRKPLFGK
jgi:hypothetical protein